MNVGILGSGEVAQALGGGFLKHGHEPMLGTRDSAKLAGWAKQHAGGRVGSVAEAAKFGELVVLSVKGAAALDDSQLERLQREFPRARFVKAFNSVGSSQMVNPQFKGGPPTMFICGNDDAAKKTVTGILDQFGWETADMGKAEAARAIEPLCILWCIPGFLRQDWVHAFKLLR